METDTVNNSKDWLLTTDKTNATNNLELNNLEDCLAVRDMNIVSNLDCNTQQNVVNSSRATYLKILL